LRTHTKKEYQSVFFHICISYLIKSATKIKILSIFPKFNIQKCYENEYFWSFLGCSRISPTFVIKIRFIMFWSILQGNFLMTSCSSLPKRSGISWSRKLRHQVGEQIFPQLVEKSQKPYNKGDRSAVTSPVDTLHLAQSLLFGLVRW
jgi:hypothetical protein